MADGFERTALECLLQIAGAGLAHARAGLQHLVAEAVAGAEQQQRFIAELLSRNFRFPAPGMICGHDDAKGLIVDRLRHYARVGKRQRQDRHVEFPGLEPCAERCGKVFLQDEGHVRRALAQYGYELRQQVRTHGVDGADAQRRCEFVFALRRDLPDGRGFLEHAPRLFDDARAERRRGYIGRVTLEKCDSEFCFEFFDRERQGGLADETFLRCAAEVAFARQRDDIAQFGQGHSAFTPASLMTLPQRANSDFT